MCECIDAQMCRCVDTECIIIHSMYYHYVLYVSYMYYNRYRWREVHVGYIVQIMFL